MSPLYNIRLMMAIALLTTTVSAENFPYAKDTFKDNKLQLWTLEKVRMYRDKTIGVFAEGDSVMKKDSSANLDLLGYWSKIKEGISDNKVSIDDDPNAVIFKTVLDLTDVTGLVYFAIHVDDIATLSVTEIDDAETAIGTTIPYEVKGTALWRVNHSYKEFPNPILAGRKYALKLNYQNTANLTDKYNGSIDYDGVNVFLMHHSAVDLDIDSNNDEGFDFTWGHENEDKIEASASLPGKIIAVPIEPDADKDSVPDFMDFGGISPGPEKQFVQMVVHLPPNYDPETATVTFGYPMSKTTDISAAQPPNSGFRIWTQNGNAPRSLVPIPLAPDATSGYLVKDGQLISWKNLAAQCALNPVQVKEGVYDGHAIILYLETVITYTGGSLLKTQPQQIKVTANNGSSSEELKTEDVVNITVLCTGGVRLTGPKAVMVNDNHHNRDASGNQLDKWDYSNDQTGTLDPDVKAIEIEITALDQDVVVILSSDAMKGLGEPGTPTTGGLIDGVYPGSSDPAGAATDTDGQSKKGWIPVDPATPCTFKVEKFKTFKQKLFIEGQRHSATVDDVIIKVEITGKDTKGKDIFSGSPNRCIATTEAEHKMTVYQVDLDVDSDNDSGFTFNEGTDEEDKIEVSAGYPGKLIFTSLDLDTNNDGIPDYENNIDNKAENKDAKFIPMKIKLLEPYDLSNTEITLKYDEANVSNMASGLRIWTKNAIYKRTTADDLISDGKAISWANLLKATSSTGREVTVFIETINTFGTPISTEKRIKLIAKQQGVLDTIDEVDVSIISIDIEEVISDQIAGNNANKLPTAFYKGEPNNPMLMATRTGRDAHLLIRMNVSPSFASKILVGAKRVDAAVILGSAASVAPPGLTPLRFDADSGHHIYEIIAGYDANNNGLLETSEVACVFSKTPKTDSSGAVVTNNLTLNDKIIIVTDSAFKSGKSNITVYNVWGTDYAGDLISAFAHGTTSIPTATTTTPHTIISKQPGLSHPVGAKWDPSLSAVTHKVSFYNGSEAVNDVKASNALSQVLEEAISSNLSAIKLATGTNWTNSGPYTFSVSRDFVKTDSEWIGVNELGYAFGKVTFTGTIRVSARHVVGGKIEIGSVDYSTSFDDVFDVTYWGGDKAREASLVQAGHATLAATPEPNSGKVFFTQVVCSGNKFIDKEF